MPRLGPADVGCWVLKTTRPPAEMSPGWAAGEARAFRRCVRRSYRLDLMAPGQRCLLWLSGRDRPGVHAIGVLAGSPEGPPGEEPGVEVVLHLLGEPVPRAELLATAGFSGAEVVRMPAGSNPSYLTAPQLRPLLDRLDPADLRAAGWA